MTKTELIQLVERIVDERIKYHLNIHEIKQGNTQKTSVKHVVREEIKRSIPLPDKLKNTPLGNVLMETQNTIDQEHIRKERILNDQAPLTINDQLNTLVENQGDASFNIKALQNEDLSFLTRDYSKVLKKMSTHAEKARPV